MAGPAVPTTLLIPILVVLTLPKERADGLQVYDCDGPNTTYQVISMLEPEGCPDPEKDYEEPRLEVVQVLQSQKEAHVTAYRCLIKRTIRVTTQVHQHLIRITHSRMEKDAGHRRGGLQELNRNQTDQARQKRGREDAYYQAQWDLNSHHLHKG